MNPDKKFLENIAVYLLNHYDDLSNHTLIFPNKRSALFLKKYMQDALRSDEMPRFMPRFATMGNFVSRFATRPEMAESERLFLLYDCYRKVLANLGREEQLTDFDRFIFWGGMILDDFDDIDRQLVNADKLFKNLRDLKEINADYLDDEQKKVVRQIWGETAKTAAVTEFWTHVNNIEGDTAEARFINLWEVLGDLYTEFNSRLASRGLNTPGGQYREAATIIADTEKETLAKRHYSFIGFNNLSHSEILIFKCLKDAGAADFFWDFDSALMSLAIDGQLGRQMRRLSQLFPMPEDFEPAMAENLPEIEVIAVPSCIGQTKAVSHILTAWSDNKIIAAGDNINTAVVLPDESLLTPLMMSVPDSISAINITMGVPFNSTAFASMLHSIVSMQLRSRIIRGEVYFFYADVNDLLSHPHLQIIAPEKVEEIKWMISKDRLFNIKASMICEKYPELAFIFRPVKDDRDHNEIYDYMMSLLDGLAAGLNSQTEGHPDGFPETEALAAFSTKLGEINRLIDDYRINMNESTYFSLFERLMQSRRIDLQGTPLQGMQVMGVLETRGLDFENLIILSMNENSFPRKSYMRTMIPNNLRIGYGMTTIDRQDSLYTYYFYRLLSRAKNVKLIYDSRTGSFGAGEASRYIVQLRHIAPDHVTFKHLSLPSEISTNQPITVRKTKEVMRELDCLRSGKGQSRLSASALKEYHKCRLRFYLSYIKNLRGQNEIEDGISASTYGSIVHKVAEVLYKDYEGKTITKEILTNLRNNSERTNRIINRVILENYYSKAGFTSAESIPAEGSITASIISVYIHKMLEIDTSLAPFVYKKGELSVSAPWRINNGLTVNFVMAIDRVDEIGENHLRFIDYKTGGDKVAPTSIDEMFKEGNYDASAQFQLLVYCLAYSDMIKECAIQPLVYPLRTLASEEKAPSFVVDKQEILDYHQIEPEFRDRLFAMIEEIFDENVPFDQAKDESSCTFCPFLDLCNRKPKTFD